jgi:hypothetical protein
VSPNVVIQDVEEGVRGSKKRCKQCHQETAPTVGDDSGNNKQADSSDVVRATAAAGSGKRQVRLPTNHSEKLLDETSLNHAYPIKHKLKDYGMIKNFMALRSRARGMEVDEAPDEGDTMLFLGEDVVMTIYNRHSSSGMRSVSNPSLGTSAHYSWGCRNSGK